MKIIYRIKWEDGLKMKNKGIIKFIATYSFSKEIPDTKKFKLIEKKNLEDSSIETWSGYFDEKNRIEKQSINYPLTNKIDIFKEVETCNEKFDMLLVDCAWYLNFYNFFF